MYLNCTLGRFVLIRTQWESKYEMKSPDFRLYTVDIQRKINSVVSSLHMNIFLTTLPISCAFSEIPLSIFGINLC